MFIDLRQAIIILSCKIMSHTPRIFKLSLIYKIRYINASDFCIQIDDQNSSDTISCSISNTCALDLAEESAQKTSEPRIMEEQLRLLFTDLNRLRIPTECTDFIPTYSYFATYAYYATNSMYSWNSDNTCYAHIAKGFQVDKDIKHICDVYNKNIKLQIVALPRPAYVDYATYAIYSHNSFNTFYSNYAIRATNIILESVLSEYQKDFIYFNEGWKSHFSYTHPKAKLSCNFVSDVAYEDISQPYYFPPDQFYNSLLLLNRFTTSFEPLENDFIYKNYISENTLQSVALSNPNQTPITYVKKNIHEDKADKNKNEKLSL